VNYQEFIVNNLSIFTLSPHLHVHRISQAQLFYTHICVCVRHIYIYIYIYIYISLPVYILMMLYLSIQKQNNSDTELEEKRKKINMAQFMLVSWNFLGIIERNLSQETVSWLLLESNPFRMYFRSAVAVSSYELVYLVSLCKNRTHWAQLQSFN